jgi:hypothetical protein
MKLKLDRPSFNTGTAHDTVLQFVVAGAALLTVSVAAVATVAFLAAPMDPARNPQGVTVSAEPPAVVRAPGAAAPGDSGPVWVSSLPDIDQQAPGTLRQRAIDTGAYPYRGGAAAALTAASGTDASSPPAAHPAVYPSITYFLVDSLTQYEAVLQEQASIAASRAAAGEASRFSVFVAGTPDEEADALAIITEARQHWWRCCGASPIKVEDLRSR